jgi:hypothetical protein
MFDTKIWLKKLTIPLRITYPPSMPIFKNIFHIQKEITFENKEHTLNLVNSQHKYWYTNSKQFVKQILKGHVKNQRKIKYYSSFVRSYQRRQDRIRNRIDFQYKPPPPPPPIINAKIPSYIVEECLLVNNIKKHLKKFSHPNNVLKYEPFANLKNLREDMLGVIRKN